MALHIATTTSLSNCFDVDIFILPWSVLDPNFNILFGSRITTCFLATEDFEEKSGNKKNLHLDFDYCLGLVEQPTWNLLWVLKNSKSVEGLIALFLHLSNLGKLKRKNVSLPCL